MTGSHDPAAPGSDASGWIEAFAFVIAVSVLNVLYAYAVARGAHVVVFVLYAMIGTSVAMLAMSGLGADAARVIAHPASWVYGISTVALEGVYFLLVGLVSPAEASLTARLSVPMSLLVAWVYFSARLEARQIIGSIIVVAAVAPVLMMLPAQNRNAATILGVLTALIVAIKTYASEYHPWNRRAGSIAEKVRVTGLVVLAATLLGVLATVVTMLAEAAGAIGPNAFTPSPGAFTHGPTIVLALGFGVVTLVAMSYLTFSSVVKIGTSNFLATSAVTPLSAYGLQLLAARAGLIEAPAFDFALLVPILLGIAGMLMIVTRGNGSPR